MSDPEPGHGTSPAARPDKQEVQKATTTTSTAANVLHTACQRSVAAYSNSNEWHRDSDRYHI